jgi:hypothetical protein
LIEVRHVFCRMMRTTSLQLQQMGKKRMTMKALLRKRSDRLKRRTPVLKMRLIS